MKNPFAKLLFFLQLITFCFFSNNHALLLCYGWEWEDMIGGGIRETVSSTSETMSIADISAMRARDIKRRLSRTHGYSADELAKMLDKKELIQTLAFEEHKVREIEIANHKRSLLKKGILISIIAVALVLFWPLFHHAWEVGHVNFVVYTDRKKYEAIRCWELQSKTGLLGVALMFALDLLQLWLSGSILLSWFIKRNRYFFPIPSLPIYPAQFMNAGVAGGPLGGYGINIGPMIISWLLRFVNGKLESWTGKQLSHAQRRQQLEKKKSREGESPEERQARKAARRAARAARKEAAEAAAAAAAAAEDDDDWGSEDPTTTTTTTTLMKQQQQQPHGPAPEYISDPVLNNSESNNVPNFESKWVQEMLKHEQSESDDKQESDEDESEMLEGTTMLDDLD